MLKMKKKSSIGKKINKSTLYLAKIGLKYRCLKKSTSLRLQQLLHKTRGPRTFYRSPDNQQQTVQSEKKTTRMTGFKWMHVSSAIYQYVAVNICSEGVFRQGKSPSSTYFCPALDPPLGISGPNHYQNGRILSKGFFLWSSLWLLLALLWIHPWADLIKSLNTCTGHENFIPTKFHKHPWSGSVVKADSVFQYINMH